jgi:outer membrane protein assembly factor BamB
VERTGYTTDPGPGGNLNLIWTFTADEYLNPIVEADGKVIAYGSNGGLFAIDALTGEQMWAIDLSAGAAGDPTRSSQPAVDDGKVFVTTQEGELVAVDLATGELVWSQRIVNELPANPMYPVAFEGVVYVVANGDQFLGLDTETGEQVWEAQVPGTVSWKSSTIAEGRIFVADDGGRLHAFDLATGELIWSTENIAASRLPAYRNGVLFVPGSDERTTAVSAEDGSIVWQTEPPADWFDSLSLIVTDDAVIAMAEISPARALDPETGEVLWTVDFGEAYGIDPHAGGDTLYVQQMDSTFAAYSLEDGSLIAATTPNLAVGSTAAISGNMIFLSGLGGTIRAFGPVATTTQENVATQPVERTPVPEESDATPEGSQIAE